MLEISLHGASADNTLPHCFRLYVFPATLSYLSNNTKTGGALIKDVREREGLVLLLHELERDHAWPTAWIISSLRDEWNS